MNGSSETSRVVGVDTRMEHVRPGELVLVGGIAYGGLQRKAEVLAVSRRNQFHVRMLDTEVEIHVAGTSTVKIITGHEDHYNRYPIVSNGLVAGARTPEYGGNWGAKRG